MRTTRTYQTTRPTTYRRNTGPYTGTRGGWSYSPTKFRNANHEIQWRMCSYQFIYNQFKGVGKVTAFSPATANRWIRFVDNGVRVFKFNSQQFSHYFGRQWNQQTPNATYRWMRQKFGQGIKAVTRGKGNCWLVAATDRINSRPFANYNWKW